MFTFAMNVSNDLIDFSDYQIQLRNIQQILVFFFCFRICKINTLKIHNSTKTC